MDSARHLWVPLRTPDDHGARAWAAQLLEMLVAYGLVHTAWLTDEGEEGFVVIDDAGRRTLNPERVLDEYGDRLARMASRVMEHSALTTTRVSVTVGPPGPVPYIESVGDRVQEYARYWPTPTRPM
ncbi:hypothetical protein [Nocardiopsis sp. MG754419]|uniref:hypothetical protein n=1 Tax=Nocardiopsis sp. MG754419 TaxID=2259865 RepID=UPI001BAB19B5|nr:hypothetical protein [Nocardiopsis sp. MG754419]MBR8743952.1 hypothetical protein [Nocardiopsis sp. MG754419]